MGRGARGSKFIAKSLWWLIKLPFKLVFVLLIWIFSSDKRYSDGYVLTKSASGKDQFEHRQIAEAVLERRLRPGEVVHHINGRRDDNHPSNLCVMSRANHDRYHAWYDWMRANFKHRPRREKQLKKLREDFGGILLEDVVKEKRLFG